jgi:hypothetical protein
MGRQGQRSSLRKNTKNKFVWVCPDAQTEPREDPHVPDPVKSHGITWTEADLAPLPSTPQEKPEEATTPPCRTNDGEAPKRAGWLRCPILCSLFCWRLGDAEKNSQYSLRHICESVQKKTLTICVTYGLKRQCRSSITTPDG